MKKLNLGKILLVLIVPLAAAWLGLQLFSGLPPGEAAMAEYRLANLTCGSCAAKVDGALRALPGIETVEVDLTSNRGRVVFDPRKVDSRTIAATLTAAGYPARLRAELTADEYLALTREQEKLGQQYLARIGERLLARGDFEALVAQRAQDVSPAERTGLRRALWDKVLQRELMLEAAARNGVFVQEGEIDARLAELGRRHQGFEQMIAQRYPDRQALRTQLRDDMTIERNLESHVFAGTSSPQQKQQLFRQWLGDLQNTTEVVIFDPEFKALAQGGSGCGGGCCG